MARLKYLDAKKQNGIASDSVVSASVLSLRFSHVQCFATLWTVAQQVPQSMGFSRQEYWNGLPCPPPGDLPDPGIKSESPALQADSLLPEPPGKPYIYPYISATQHCKSTIRQQKKGNKWCYLQKYVSGWKTTVRKSDHFNP